MSLNRADRGFALIELLMGLILFGLIGGVMLRTTLSMERTTHAHLSRLGIEGSLDTGIDFLSSELASLGRDSTGTDLVSQALDSLSYRAERATGLACQVTATSVRTSIARYAGSRQPQPGRDSLLLYLGEDALLHGPGPWVAAPVLAVRAATCGSSPAWDIVTTIDTTRFSLANIAPWTPIRFFEVMQSRLYLSGGATWLGVRSISAGEVIQPLAGPFTPGRSGFLLRDSAGGVATAPAATRRILIGLSGAWTGWPATGLPPGAESTGVTIAPGNLQP